MSPQGSQASNPALPQVKAALLVAAGVVMLHSWYAGVFQHVTPLFLVSSCVLPTKSFS